MTFQLRPGSAGAGQSGPSLRIQRGPQALPDKPLGTGYLEKRCPCFKGLSLFQIVLLHFIHAQ